MSSSTFTPLQADRYSWARSGGPLAWLVSVLQDLRTCTAARLHTYAYAQGGGGGSWFLLLLFSTPLLTFRSLFLPLMFGARSNV